MKNALILIIFAILAGLIGWWYFAGRPSPEMSSMSVMEHKNMSAMAAEESSFAPEKKHGASEDKKAEEQVECPVMGTKLLPSRAYGKTEYKGKTYYFCCAGCPGEFKRNPEKYAK